MPFLELDVERRVVERRLHGCLAVVEVAAHPEDRHVRPTLRDHLLALDVGDAVGWVEDAHARVRAVGEALERRLSRVSRRRHEHEEVVRRHARGDAPLNRLGEEHGHALQGHVLERRGRPVPELEHVHPWDDLLDRRDRLGVEVRAVRDPHQLLDAVARHVDAEAPVHVRRPAPVRHPGEAHDLVERQRGQPLGDEQSTAGRQPLDDGVEERVASRVLAAGVAIQERLGCRPVGFHCRACYHRAPAKRLDGGAP